MLRYFLDINLMLIYFFNTVIIIYKINHDNMTYFIKLLIKTSIRYLLK
jgi:hypothetical protein